MKDWTRLLCATTALASTVIAAPALAAGIDAPANFEIAAGSLDEALIAYSRQADVQVVSASADVAGKRTGGVNGQRQAREALAILLRDSGLSFVVAGEQTVTVVQDPQGGSAGVGADGGDVDALIVTAQKREEAIQDVPIAISAFTQKSLDAQKIEGGFDLLKAIPNVTFSKNNFSGYNFSIRGIGTKAVSATTDPGVAVSFNNTTLIVNRLFEQEYVDMERVEVLRGPQGTLYGRNATSGVINMISAKPRMGEFAADMKLEAGNYNAQRVRGMVNIPIGDTFAIRAAGAMTRRDGYATNILTGEDVDDRNLWTSRITLGWEPIEQIRMTLLWERFEENDARLRSVKQLCHRDPGLNPDDYGVTGFRFQFTRQTTQGCAPGSLYEDSAFGTPAHFSMPHVVIGAQLLPPDFEVYASRTQSRNLREIEMQIPAEYKATSDIADLTFDIDLNDSLTFTSQTVYAEDSVWSTQDLNRFNSSPGAFIDSTTVNGFQDFFYGPGWTAYFQGLTKNGIYCDPQLGCSDRLIGQDLSMAKSSQFNQEFRLGSAFDGPINFSLGANYTRFETQNDYYVFINYLTYLAQGGAPSTQPVFAPGGGITPCSGPPLALPLPQGPFGSCAVYIDPNPIGSLNGEGHNYFRSSNPYEMSSAALFGELYWQLSPTVKVTAGLRTTWDKKVFTPVPSQTLLVDYRDTTGPGMGPNACLGPSTVIPCVLAGTGIDGRGYPAEADITLEWREPTGRIIVDWKPDLGFTNQSLVYLSLAHGYKGGGMNPPSVSAPQGSFNQSGRTAFAGPTFEPEFIDALEVGSKNTLLDGALVLNGSAFYYDYQGYQVSKIIDRSAANENFDAIVWGAELEWVFSPTRNLRFNGTFGALRTELADGQTSIDLMDRLQGHTDWVIIKPGLTQTTNCLAPVSLVVAALNSGDSNGQDLTPFCAAGGFTGINYRNRNIPGTAGLRFDPATDAPNGGAGFSADVSGNELPNAPHWTASLGGQYRMALPGGWDATLRGDFYWQSQSYSRIYNTQYDKLRAWTNANLSFWVENPDWGVTAEVYVKNVFEETPITDAFLFSDDTGLTTNIFTLDPRLVGVSIRKSF